MPRTRPIVTPSLLLLSLLLLGAGTAAAAANLVPNGTFDLDTAGWTDMASSANVKVGLLWSADGATGGNRHGQV